MLDVYWLKSGNTIGYLLRYRGNVYNILYMDDNIGLLKLEARSKCVIVREKTTAKYNEATL